MRSGAVPQSPHFISVTRWTCLWDGFYSLTTGVITALGPTGAVAIATAGPSFAREADPATATRVALD
jgi:hypothetical protein